MKTLSEVTKNNRTTTIIRTAFVVLSTVLILVFSFIDLDVSKSLYGMNNTFGAFFAEFFYAVGYAPAILVDVFLFVCIFFIVKKKVIKVVMVFLIVGGLFGTFYTSFEFITGTLKYVISSGLAMIGAIGILLLFSRINKGNLNKLLYIFLISAMLATISIIVVAILQFTWGRDRYFSVLDGSGSYTAWIFPQGFDESIAHRAFPSMHASSVFSMTTLIWIALTFNFKKWLKVLLIVVSCVLLICVPVSRVVMGWHYMTDILFGLFISYGAFELAMLFGDKFYNKYIKINIVDGDKRS